MNLSSQVSSTKVYEEDQGGLSGAYGGDSEEAIVSDKALKISERICKMKQNAFNWVSYRSEDGLEAGDAKLECRG
jgi:hypothetical protein